MFSFFLSFFALSWKMLVLLMLFSFIISFANHNRNESFLDYRWINCWRFAFEERLPSLVWARLAAFDRPAIAMTSGRWRCPSFYRNIFHWGYYEFCSPCLLPYDRCLRCAATFRLSARLAQPEVKIF